MKNKDLLKALKICAFIPIIGAIIVLFAGMIIFKKRRYTLKDLLKLYLIFIGSLIICIVPWVVVNMIGQNNPTELFFVLNLVFAYLGLMGTGLLTYKHIEKKLKIGEMREIA